MRGLALLGIFIMNMPGFASSFHAPEPVEQARRQAESAPDAAVSMLAGLLLEGKFNGLFTLLFGLGLALQLSRLEAPRSLGIHAGVGIVVRRLLALWAFGLAHAVLLWGGDVLHIYAVLGLGLLMVRRWSDKALLALASGLLLAQFAHSIVMAWLWSPERHAIEQAFLTELHARDETVYGHGPWWDGVLLRAQSFALRYSAAQLLGPQSWFWLALATTAVLGLWAHRAGWLNANRTAGRWLASATGLRALLGLWLFSAGLWLLAAQLGTGPEPGEAPRTVHLWAWALQDTHRVLMVLSYAGLTLRWCQGPEDSGLRRLLAEVGRMPLTCYLLQSLMGTFIFHAWGLGFWGEMGRTAQTALAVLLFATVQVPLAHLWLSRHAQGPAEAMWRWLSYGRTSALGKAQIDRNPSDR